MKKTYAPDGRTEKDTYDKPTILCVDVGIADLLASGSKMSGVCAHTFPGPSTAGS